MTILIYISSEFDSLLLIYFFFFKYGANLNQNDFFDQTCLLYAINSADLNIIQLLVENGMF